MSKPIYTIGMILFIGSIFLGLVVGLTGCASDGYQSSNRNDGSGKSWQDRAFEPKGGGSHNLAPAADEILGSGCCG